MSNKFLQHDAAGGFREVQAVTTGGAPQANKIPSLDASGRLDPTMMPTGVGAETSIIPAFGALAAGDLVNVFNDAGVIRCRKADASSGVAPAHGFVLSAVSAGANATVYWGGLNNMRTGMTPGQHFLGTTAGLSSHIAPSTAGNIVQKVGIALNSTTLNFEPSDPILLA